MQSLCVLSHDPPNAWTSPRDEQIIQACYVCCSARPQAWSESRQLQLSNLFCLTSSPSVTACALLACSLDGGFELGLGMRGATGAVRAHWGAERKGRRGRGQS